MSKFQEIKELIANMEKDADAFQEKRVAAAGKRLRSGFQTLKTLAQEGRVEVLETIKAGKQV